MSPFFPDIANIFIPFDPSLSIDHCAVKDLEYRAGRLIPHTVKQDRDKLTWLINAAYMRNNMGLIL